MCNEYDIVGSSGKMNLRRFTFLIAMSGMLVLTGCAVAGNSVADITSADQLITKSVVEKAKPEGINDTDAKVIRESVAAAPSPSSSVNIPWSNSETGSSGRIISIEKFQGNHGQNCRGFRTSVKSYAGVGYYIGETCQVDDERWVLSWFKAV